MCPSCRVTGCTVAYYPHTQSLAGITPGPEIFVLEYNFWLLTKQDFLSLKALQTPRAQFLRTWYKLFPLRFSVLTAGSSPKPLLFRKELRNHLGPETHDVLWLLLRPFQAWI